MAEQILYIPLKDLHRYVPMPPHDEGGAFLCRTKLSRKHEKAKARNGNLNFRVFQISCFRDECLFLL